MKSSKNLWRRIAPVIGVAFWLMVSATVVLAQGRAVQRPIEDFVDAQGTYCIDDGAGGCFLFVPPIENFLGESSPDGLCASVDYAGLANAKAEELSGGSISFGTTTTGTVTERPLADGRAEVSVRLRTTNALAWVARASVPGDCNYAEDPLLFGNRLDDVLDGADAALGESLVKVKFINTAPGAPLPDLIQLIVDPEPGQEFPSFILINARADGTLRELYGVTDGTPGRAEVIQTGLFMTKFKGATADGFPAERINLMVVGH